MNNLSDIKKFSTEQVLLLLGIEYNIKDKIRVDNISVDFNVYSSIVIISIYINDVFYEYYVKFANEHDLVEQGISCDIENEYKILNKLNDRYIFVSNLGVVKAVSFNKKYNALITISEPGNNFSYYLNIETRLGFNKNKHNKVLYYCSLAGRWLREFHIVTFYEESNFNISPIIDICNKKLNYLLDTNSIFITKKVKDNVIKSCLFIYNEIDCKKTPISLRHADFSPHNMIIREDDLTVLDFTTSHNESIYYDLCNFLCSIDYLRFDLRSNSKLCKVMKVNFIDEYEKSFTIDNRFIKIIYYQYILINLVKTVDILTNSELNFFKRINYKYIYLRLVFLLRYKIIFDKY